MSLAGGVDKESETHPIPFQLHRKTFYHVAYLGSFDLEMPVGIGLYGLPILYLNLMDKSEAHALKLMKVLYHANILHLWALNELEGKSSVAAYVDPFSGVLSSLLTPSKASIMFGSAENVIPSFELQDLVSQVVDGLDYLRENGYYHGNLSAETILYFENTSGYTIKLAYFERKDKKLEDCQKDDVVSLGEFLEEIADFARSKGPNQLDFCLIDDLSKKLKSFSFSSLKTVKKEVKDHPFFWDSIRRKEFYTSEVPIALGDAPFIAKIQALPIRLPWNTDRYSGYLNDMDNYRARKGLAAYNGSDKVHYVQCMSGLYAHEVQLRAHHPGRISVDTAIQSRKPQLCLDLKNAMS